MAASETTPPSAPRRRLRALWAIVPAAVLMLVSVWEVIVIVRAGDDVPTPADWKAASRYVRAHHRPGDLILFAPRWLGPVGRLHLGDLISIKMAGRMDAARYGVMWELSARGARAPETRGLAPVTTRRFGVLTVRHFQRKPAQVISDFLAAFPSASVSGPATRRVHVELQEVGFQPHRCVLVIPRPNTTVTVTYPHVALGTKLVGYVGLADVFTRRDVRDPGRLVVRIGGNKVATAVARDENGWVRFSAATQPTRDATVSFAATAVGRGARQRLICFAAEARK